VDPLPTAPGDKDVVEKLASVIGVERARRHGEALADEVDRGADAHAALAPDGLTLRPAGDDIDGDEGSQVEALRALFAMADEISLEAPGTGLLPPPEGADRDLRCQRRGPGTSSGEAMG
jgi:hypothetical protein